MNLHSRPGCHGSDNFNSLMLLSAVLVLSLEVGAIGMSLILRN